MSNVSKCFFCANKKDYDAKLGYFGCDYSGQECKKYSMFEPKVKPKPITNADRIRGMSVEGLADLFAKIEHADPENHLGKEGWLVWLKMEGKT